MLRIVIFTCPTFHPIHTFNVYMDLYITAQLGGKSGNSRLLSHSICIHVTKPSTSRNELVYLRVIVSAFKYLYPHSMDGPKFATY